MIVVMKLERSTRAVIKREPEGHMVGLARNSRDVLSKKAFA